MSTITAPNVQTTGKTGKLTMPIEQRVENNGCVLCHIFNSMDGGDLVSFYTGGGKDIAVLAPEWSTGM